jgi:S1-C subfamily serine protease
VPVVDVVLILLILLFAISGYRQGFVIGLLSFIGFFGGALVGLQLGPLLADRFTGGTTRIVVALVTVFGLATIGQTAAGWIGTHLRHAITSRAGRKIDDVGGALVSVVAVALVAWLVAVPLGSSALPGVAGAVRNSSILHAVDRVMPDRAQALSESLRETLDTNGFPNVLGGLAPTRAREVASPDPALAASEAVVNGERSVVKVLGSAPSCSRRIEGSGFVYAQRRVMTNAHVVAGTRSVSVELDGDRYSARVVVYDTKRDLAVLYVPGLAAPALSFAESEARTEDDAIVLGFPQNGPYNAQPARIREVGKITGPDIYDSGDVTREVYTIRALVRSGNSGGPLVRPDGRVLGVIFAAAADNRNVGFAVTVDEARPVIEAGLTRTENTETGDCA